ncbi:MAG: hypothetical protein JWR77_312 [Rhizorhabdus sp.]|nr:hypothetical protein [Rhizorhabdus sp.]
MRWRGRQVQSIYAIPTMFFSGLCVTAIAGDWWRVRRRREAPEKVGLIPWSLIMTLSLLLAVVFASFWLREN